VEFRRVLEARRSLRSFSSRPVEDWKVARMLEAARWSPSCSNRQPWGFVAVRLEDSSRGAVDAALDAGNGWAKAAPVLVVSCTVAERDLAVESRHYGVHDAGIALSTLLLEGVELGLRVHPMAGWREGALAEALALPEGVRPAAVVAVGYAGDPADLPEAARKKDELPRTRLPFAEVAHRGAWGTPHPPPPPADPPLVFETDVPVRFSDLDAMGHVNNVSYFTLIEEGRIAFARHAYGLKRVEEISFVIVDSSCRYLHPILLHDRVRIRMQVTDLSRSSFRFRYLLFDPGSGRGYAEGESVQVAYDHREKKAMAIPPAIAERLREYAGI
jgi:YbgC/YbaW family acyl-CoA thioester hydrolase